MAMHRFYLAFIVGLFAWAHPSGAGTEDFGRYVSQSAFADVLFELDNAIVARGLSIHSSGNQFARMLDRTGSDVGSTTQVYKDASFIEVCSAKYARMMVEADPALISNCPFIFYVYVLVDRPKDVVVSFRRLSPGTSAAAQKAVAETEAMLDSITREAAK
jgi:uncharacterized protein (DUF302 family)